MSPTIVFQVDLETPLRNSHVDPTNLVAEGDNFKETRSTHFPDDLLNNRKLTHGDQFTVTGEEAVYLKNNYTSGNYAILTVVSETI